MEEKPRESPAKAEAAPPLPVETPAEAPRRRPGGGKRKGSGSGAAAAPPPKRLAKERSVHHLPPQVHNGPCTRARQSPNKVAGAGGPQKPQDHSIEAAGEGGKVAPSAGDPIDVDEKEEKPLVDAEFDAIRSRGTDAHVVPTHAGWFSWKRIHLLEKHGLPSFFNGKSENRTPEIYLEIRNCLMKKFHLNPKTPVELKDLSELAAGDMDARQEVMEFLDHWGLINFHPFPPSNPDELGQDADTVAKVSSLIEKLYQFETVEPLPPSNSKDAKLPPPAALPRFIPEPTLADELVRPEGPLYHCNSCSADCSRKRYHCQKQADFDLCSECYNNGKFGSPSMTAADFILMEPGEVPGASGGSWTDQETLLLLEALELFGENWNEIGEHVATKTKAQCILHFVQMRIEDSFLEVNDEMDGNMHIQIEQGSVDKESAGSHAPGAKEIENSGDEIQPVLPSKDASKLNDASESSVSEVKGDGKVDVPIIKHAVDKDASKEKDSDETEISCETGTNLAVDVLKTAFQAVGYFPEHGRSSSFADAGNPVMALAAFLACLVGPDDTVPVQSSLKATSEDSPSIQLATRHCFLLEDPPNDEKALPASESHAKNLDRGLDYKEEDQMSIPEETNEQKTSTRKDKDDSAPVGEMKSSISSKENVQKETEVKESGDLAFPSDVTHSTTNDSDDPSLPKERMAPSTMKEVDDSAPSGEIAAVTKDKLEDLPLQPEDRPRTVEETNGLKLETEEKTNAMEECDNMASVEVVQQCSSSSKSAETMRTLASLEEKEIEKRAGTKSDERDKSMSPSNGAKTESPYNGEKCDLAENDDDCNIDRLKRAAVTALSAAAVKAKLLADEEEDQIRQLVSVVIDKQLHKLETKLAFFADIESVLLRVKEQIERSKQRLFHERAAIIAARFGLSASSNRVNPSSVSSSRVAMSFGTGVAKPQNMMSQKPPVTRRP